MSNTTELDRKIAWKAVTGEEHASTVGHVYITQNEWLLGSASHYDIGLIIRVSDAIKTIREKFEHEMQS